MKDVRNTKIRSNAAAGSTTQAADPCNQTISGRKSRGAHLAAPQTPYSCNLNEGQI